MQAIVWLLSGVFAGWMARLLMKGQRSGFLGDFTLGILGGVSGAWLLRSIGGSMPPAGSPAHIAVAVIGAMVLVGVGRVLVRFTRHVKTTSMGTVTPGIPDLEGYVRRLGKVERTVLNAILRHQTLARDASESFSEQLSLGQRTADRVAQFGGSWTFLGLFAAFMLGWILLNSTQGRPFDPYPFILLNLILSCLAAVQAPVIMMSQNRQSEKDRFDAQQDYQVNLKSEMEVMGLHAKLDEARDSQWKALLDLQNRQMDILFGLERRLDMLEVQNPPRGAQ
jgi:uncharacterized membrane protein/uncharacterized membrane protein YeaQ/YmgE (transglycosylase-associated protein family)